MNMSEHVSNISKHVIVLHPASEGYKRNVLLVRAASHRIAPHRTASHRIAPHRTILVDATTTAAYGGGGGVSFCNVSILHMLDDLIIIMLDLHCLHPVYKTLLW